LRGGSSVAASATVLASPLEPLVAIKEEGAGVLDADSVNLDSPRCHLCAISFHDRARRGARGDQASGQLASFMPRAQLNEVGPP
jgi:hypothetical protein